MSYRRVLASIGRYVGQCPRGKLSGVLTYNLRSITCDVNWRCMLSVFVMTLNE